MLSFYERIGDGSSSSSAEVVSGEIFVCHEPIEEVIERVQHALNLRYFDSVVIKSVVMRVTSKVDADNDDKVIHKQAIAFYADLCELER